MKHFELKAISVFHGNYASKCMFRIIEIMVEIQEKMCFQRNMKVLSQKLLQFWVLGNLRTTAMLYKSVYSKSCVTTTL